MSSLVSISFNYFTLPDLSGYIRYHPSSCPSFLVKPRAVTKAACRACFTRKYFTAKWIGPITRAAQWFEHIKRRRPAGAAEASELFSPSMYLAGSWITTYILPECIPCMQHLCRKNNKGTPLSTLKPTRKEIDAVITLLYGTFLKLYPRGHKTPTFQARVLICRRIFQLLNSPHEIKSEFVEMHPNLIRLCTMEYCSNVIPDFMPSEMHALKRNGCVDEFIRSTASMFDTIRREFLQVLLCPCLCRAIREQANHESLPSRLETKALQWGRPCQKTQSTGA